MRKLALISFLFFLPISIWGENYYNNEDVIERIITKNGNVYEGFIQLQKVGEEIEFQTSVRIIIDSIDSKTDIDKQFVSKDELSNKWKWIIENGRTEYHVEQGQQGLMLHSFKIKGVPVKDVVILERGEKFVRYININNKNIKIKLSDIRRFEYISEHQKKSNIIDVIQLNDTHREIKGYITKQIIGKQIFIKEDSTSFTSEIDLKNIRATKKICKNNNLSIFESSKWVEVIETNSGYKVEGIITSKTYGKSDDDAFMLVEKSDRSVEIVKTKDVVSIKRKINPLYIGYIYDIKTDSCLTINGQEIPKTAITDKIDFFTINNLANIITDIKIKNKGTKANIVLQRSLQENIGDVVAYRILNIEDNKFTYKKLLNKSIQSKQLKIGNTVIDNFTLPFGVYFFYIKGNEDFVYVVRINKE